MGAGRASSTAPRSRLWITVRACRGAARAAVRGIRCERATATQQGAGLGLTVARGFAEAMDGVLIPDASDGGGLTMRLRLPLAP